MRRLLATVILLSCLNCFSQGLGQVEQPFFLAVQTETIPIPEQIPGLSNWWLYTDLDTNTFQVTAWSDRIQGVTATNFFDPCTNFPNGMYFSRTSGLRVNYTNDHFFKSSNATTCFIFSPEVDNAFDVIYGDNVNSGFRVRRFTTGGSGVWKAGDATEATAFKNPVLSTFLDLVVVRTNGASLTVYTNGIVTAYNNVARLISAMPTDIGFSAAGANRGSESYISDVLYYTNNFSSLDLSNFHYYATNTYQFVP